MIVKAIRIIRSHGLCALFTKIKARIHQYLSGPAISFLSQRDSFLFMKGIEVGGPSHIFSKKGLFPVYPLVDQLDNCNFASATVWEGNISEGYNFRYAPNKPLGRQYLAEATDLSKISSSTYDLLLSSHVLEHTANPILALSEWIRILKDDGLLVLIVPHKDGTFDHKRPVSTLKHLINDFNSDMTEDDLTHMQEIIELHDLTRDAEAGDINSFKERSKLNLENRCFHHHVFDTRLAVSLVDYLGLKICSVEAIQPMHILIVAKKINGIQRPENSVFTSESAQWVSISPFSSDHSDN